MKGCLSCLDENTCLECFKNGGYFLGNNGRCDECSIEGCLNCLDLNTCSECFENGGYFLGDNGKCYRC